ncbi:MAG: DNA primase [Acidobacteria bacterium]|nr:DNA primase [Acidobacteriota bacterium]
MTASTAAQPRTITLAAVQAHAHELLAVSATIKHEEVFQRILDRLEPINFRKEANLENDEKLNQKHYAVVAVEKIVAAAQAINAGICRNLDFVYVFNGQYWRQVEADELAKFLGEAAEKLGVERITARYFLFRDALLKQFRATAYLPTPRRQEGVTLLNCANGTFEITTTGQRLREFRRADFLTYQLPFDYNPQAECPKWNKFLFEVLPDSDKAREKICAEFIGWCFTTHLKHETVFLPYGGGANGKSVFFDVMTALLGENNVSHYSLTSLGHEYNRAKLANKLLNYASEISSRLDSEVLKKLASGEPIEARLPYGQPFILTQYAKLAFNCNELPRDVEFTEAYFRRWLIVPFDVTIEKEKRNPNLAREIIAEELPGVFNWVLEGLKRLLAQGKFTECQKVKDALASYRRESDSVATFLVDEKWIADPNSRTTLGNLYTDYKSYCSDNGYKALGRNKFGKRLELNGIARQDQNQPVFFVRREGW